MSAIKVTAEDSKKNDVEGEVWVDGQKLGVAPKTFTVPTCSKTITLENAGRTWTDNLALKSRETSTVHAVLGELAGIGEEHAPPAPPGDHEMREDVASKRTTMLAVGGVALALGIAGILAGAITGLVAVSEKNTLDSSCPSRQCPPSAWSAVDQYDTNRTVASAGIYGGLALAVVGIIVVALAPGAPPEKSASRALGIQALGPSQPGLRGTMTW